MEKKSEETVKINKYYLTNNKRWFTHDYQKWYVYNDVSTFIKNLSFIPSRYKKNFLLTDDETNTETEFLCVLEVVIQNSKMNSEETTEELEEPERDNSKALVSRQPASFYFDQFMDKQEEIISKITDEKRSKISLERQGEIDTLTHINLSKDAEIDRLREELNSKDKVIQSHTSEFCNAYRELKDQFTSQISELTKSFTNHLHELSRIQKKLLEEINDKQEEILDRLDQIS